VPPEVDDDEELERWLEEFGIEPPPDDPGDEVSPPLDEWD